MESVGNILGRYRIEEIIDEGGMSVVYKVKDMRVGTVRAMKEISFEKMNGFKAGYTETQVLKNAKHPALPKIIDIVRTDNSYCVVMDYIEGENLNEYVRREGGFCEKDVINIGMELLDSLDYLHSMNEKIIYRDLKPSNVMITAEKEIKLIDFGISGALLDNKGIGNYATREFAPPEQLSGKRIDERSDIYSLGATLKFILKSEPSPGMKLFLEKCTDFNPDKRYKSAKEAGSALEKINAINGIKLNELKRIIEKNIFFAILFILSISGVFFSEIYRGKIKKSEYDEMVKNAGESFDSSIRLENIKKLIDKEGEGKWFEALFKEMKTDCVFDASEAEETERIVNEKEDILVKNGDFCEISKEVGRMYFFYYPKEENENEKYSRAAYWFDRNLEEGGDANAYSKTAHFLTGIKTLILEGKDEGNYSTYYYGLLELSELNEEEKTINIQINSMMIDAIFAYAGNLYLEGVSVEEMRNSLFKAKEKINDIGNNTLLESEEKEMLMNRIKEAEGELDYIEEFYLLQH